MADGGLRILLVDDDSDTQDIFALVVASHGGQLVAVKDAESALNYLESHRPDIVVIDLYLDEVDGYQILELIRQSPFDPRCPIVATTAYHTTMTKSLSLLSGFDGHLEKPLSVNDLWAYFEELTLHARNE